MGSAIATLWDWGFISNAMDQWIDPTGVVWQLSYDQASYISLVKEGLEHHSLQQIWSSSTMDAGLQQRPDLKAYHELRKQYRQEGQH